jgi:HK97 family phage major capsid protein
MEVDEKMIKELNDLVRGATEQSKTAVTELRGVVEQHDVLLKAHEQFGKDITALSTDLRAFTRSMLDRVGGTGRGRYRGSFASAEEARATGLAILGHCCKRQSALDALAKTVYAEQFKALGETTDILGGFFVQGGPLGSLIRLVEDYGVFRRNAMPYPLSRDSEPIPIRTGGLTVYCPGEGKTITASDISVGQVLAIVKDWYTLTVISAQLEQDSAIAVAELVAQEIALAFAAKEDACGFVGDGTSTYFGILGVLAHGSTTNQACAATDTTFEKACVWKYLAGIIGKLNTWALVRAAYYFHRSVFWSYVVGQVDSNGHPIVKFGPSGTGEVLEVGTPGPGLRTYLLGFPVELVDSMPTTAQTAVSTACWAFGSLWQSWLLGQRGGVEVVQDRSVYFVTNQVAIRGGERVAILPRNAAGMCKTTTAAS